MVASHLSNAARERWARFMLAGRSRVYALRSVNWATSNPRVAYRTVAWTGEAGPVPPGVVTEGSAGCCPVAPDPTPVRRLIVAYRAEGGARVSWELDPNFSVSGSVTARLEYSPSGVPDADDWVSVGPAERDPAYLVDPEKRQWGVSDTLHYRVTFSDDSGTYVSAPSRLATNTTLSAQDWYLLREVARKERLRLVSQVGTRGFLLKEKRYGILCDCVNPITRESQDSSCLRCYGRNYVGGYHPPVPCWYADLSPQEAREFVDHASSRGTVKDVVVWGRMSADVPVVQADAWVSADADMRYYVHRVRNLTEWKAVPVVYAVELRLAPKSDVLYKVPVSGTGSAECNWGRPDLKAPETVCVPTC